MAAVFTAAIFILMLFNQVLFSVKGAHCISNAR